MGGEHGLDSVPDLGRDQGFVQAVVAGAAEPDAALVVGVGQHLVDRGQHRRFGGPLRVGTVVRPRSMSSSRRLIVE